MGWRDEYKVHPAADIFPMMSDDEQASTLPTDGRSEGAVGRSEPPAVGAATGS